MAILLQKKSLVLANWTNEKQEKALKTLGFQGFRVAPPVGLEPTTPWLTVRCSTDWAKEEYEDEPQKRCIYVDPMIGNERIGEESVWGIERKAMLPAFCKEPLCLSTYVSVDLSSRAVASQVLSALQSLTSVFGMGTGGPSALITLTCWCTFRDSNPGPTD